MRGKADAEWERNRYGPDGSDRADIAARAAEEPGKWEQESEPLTEAEAAEVARLAAEVAARQRAAPAGHVGHTETATDPGRLRDLTNVFKREKDTSPSTDQSATEQADGTPAEQEKVDKEQAERELAKELAEKIDKETDREIDRVLDHLNPKYDPAKSAYKENCTGVVQAYELQRRGHDVQPGPLEKHLRTDEGGFGGRNVAAIEQPWGKTFIDGTKAEIEVAFNEPGARGVVYIEWDQGGAHVFNVENIGGEVRFMDAQPNPTVYDASTYFTSGGNTAYVRLDDRPTPPAATTARYLEP